MGWAVFFAKVSLFLLNPDPPQFKQLRETSETQHLCLLNPTLFLCGAKECSLHALRSLSELWLSWLTWFQTVPFIKTRVLSFSSFQSLRIKVQTFLFKFLGGRFVTLSTQLPHQNKKHSWPGYRSGPTKIHWIRPLLLNLALFGRTLISVWYHSQKNGISYTLKLWLVPYDISFYGLGRISFYYPEGIVYYSRFPFREIN